MRFCLDAQKLAQLRNYCVNRSTTNKARNKGVGEVVGQKFKAKNTHQNLKKWNLINIQQFLLLPE